MDAWHRDKTLHALFIIVAFSSVILFIGLENPALWDRDETQYALAATEMQSTGEWLIPTLFGRPFLEKPILTYWLVRISYIAFGVNEFSSRLSSAFFGVLTCVGTYFLATALWGRQVGIYSALILSTSFLFVGAFRLLMTDPPLIFFGVLSFVFYVYAEKSPERSNLFLVLCYVSMGFGFLAKGPVALFPTVVFVIYEVLTKRPFRPMLVCNILRHALFLTFTFLVAAPWFVYAFFVQKEATSAFFLHENIGRFFHVFEGHAGLMLYYVPVLFFGMFPWSFFVIACIAKGWRRRIATRRKIEPEVLLLPTSELLTWSGN